jgi:hypothetical protein
MAISDMKNVNFSLKTVIQRSNYFEAVTKIPAISKCLHRCPELWGGENHDKVHGGTRVRGTHLIFWFLKSNIKGKRTR